MTRQSGRDVEMLHLRSERRCRRLLRDHVSGSGLNLDLGLSLVRVAGVLIIYHCCSVERCYDLVSGEVARIEARRLKYCRPQAALTQILW